MSLHENGGNEKPEYLPYEDAMKKLGYAGYRFAQADKDEEAKLNMAVRIERCLRSIRKCTDTETMETIASRLGIDPTTFEVIKPELHVADGPAAHTRAEEIIQELL